MKGRISLFVILLLVIALIYSRLLLPRWDSHNVLSIISWDVFGYYLYLPAKFIYNDLDKLGFVSTILETYHPTETFYQAVQDPSGNFVIKYTCGLSILYAPFFFIAHLVAEYLGYPADGFSVPYQVAVAFSAIVYVSVAMVLLRKVMLAYFSDTATSLALIITLLATNLFQLTAYDGAMPHSYLFFIYSVIIYFSFRFTKSQNPFHFVLSFFFVGIATLVRPTEIISALIPLLFGISTWNDLKERLIFVLKHPIILIIASIAFLLPLSLQSFYWFSAAGKWIVYTYGGEGFNFLSPHIVNVLFSFKKGWFIYTPVMLMIIPGFYILYRNQRNLFWSFFTFFLINLWIVSSWDVWWYAGSYGMRALVQSYAVMTFALAAFIHYVFSKDFAMKSTFLVVSCMFIFLNLFQTWQYMNFIIDPTRMTSSYYFAIFGKTANDPESQKLLEVLRPFDGNEVLSKQGDYNSEKILDLDFESAAEYPKGALETNEVGAGKSSLILSKKLEFSPGYKQMVSQLTAKDYCWLQASVMVYSNDFSKSTGSLVFSFDDHGKNYKYRAYDFEKHDLKNGQWNQVTFDCITPEFRNEDDQVAVYVWFRGEGTIKIDDLKLVKYELK